MRVAIFAMPIGIILLMLLIGFVVGVAVTLLLHRKQRLASSDIANSPVTQRDPNNPYEPSTVGLRAANGTNGCAIALAFLFIAAMSLIVFVAIYLFAAARVVKAVPSPPTPPRTVVQPSQTPTTAPAPLSN